MIIALSSSSEASHSKTILIALFLVVLVLRQLSPNYSDHRHDGVAIFIVAVEAYHHDRCAAACRRAFLISRHPKQRLHHQQQRQLRFLQQHRRFGKLPTLRLSRSNNDDDDRPQLLAATMNDNSSNDKNAKYEESDAASKGIVASLTNLVNFVSSAFEGAETDTTVVEDNSLELSSSPPRSSEELLERIRSDYTEKNYLWTGDIDLACFDSRCKFQDPTISFTGRDQFVTSTQNLRPVVDALMMVSPKSGSSDTTTSTARPCASVLFDIQDFPEQQYIQTRWNMVGRLSRLPWQPKIDVIGKTKFWYKDSSNDDNRNSDRSSSTTSCVARVVAGLLL